MLPCHYSFADRVQAISFEQLDWDRNGRLDADIVSGKRKLDTKDVISASRRKAGRRPIVSKAARWPRN
jgi:hypothetical protein